jgi:hypothetical protein
MVCLEVLTAVAPPPPRVTTMRDFMVTINGEALNDDIMQALMSTGQATITFDEGSGPAVVVAHTAIGNAGDPYGIGKSLLPHLERLTPP